MKTKLSLAVAAALFAATTAQAGITIPAGDWTVDIGGNVNTFYTNTKQEGVLATAGQEDTAQVVETGLLPSALGFGAKSRQGDLDIAVQFTFFVGADSGAAASSATGNFNNNQSNGAAGANTINIRQAYMTFGDASWGTVKMGRDLGIFGSDAILSDMTLLGVGIGAGSGGSSTLGRIGSGYMYADWVGQISYASPNWNGFSFAAGIREPWTNGTSNTSIRSDIGFEGKVSYEWAGDYAGKAWAGFITQDHSLDTGSSSDYTSEGWEIGAKATAGAFGLLGYYYEGDGLAGPQNILTGLPFLAGNESDDDGFYVQGTFTVPGVGTKIGASYGESNSTAAGSAVEFTNESWIIGAYHPLTKSLNLVAEYTNNELDNIGGTAGANGERKTIALGAILFF